MKPEFIKKITKQSEMKQTILVTGASSGFGLLIASKLHETGYTVIGTSREPEKYQSKLPFKLLPLDITNDHSIESFGNPSTRAPAEARRTQRHRGYTIAPLRFPLAHRYFLPALER